MIAQIWNYNKWIEIVEPNKLKDKYNKLLVVSGFDILDFIENYFEPQGWTGLWLLGESHFAIHTFPEENKTYIELSSYNKDYYNLFIDRI